MLLAPVAEPEDVASEGGDRTMSAPKNYRSFAEFQREEIQPEQKLGWSIDDLWKEAELRVGEVQFEERDLEELDFGA